MIEELLVEDGSKVVAGQELFKIRLTEGGLALLKTVLYFMPCLSTECSG